MKTEKDRRESWRISDILYPGQCAMCEEIISRPFEEQPSPRHTTALCEDCYRAIRHCMKPRLRRIGTASALYLFDYGEASVKDLLYPLKHWDIRDLQNFCGGLLDDAMREKSFSAPFITYLPRSYRNYYKHGFDQSERLMTSLGKLRPTLTPLTLFTRSRFFTGEQKDLSKEERLLNARRSLHLKKNVTVPKSLLVIDDIVTSGATAQTALDLLYEAGAEEVAFLFLINQ